ncbi:hypothetical protein AN403_6077 [Pseudomonas fluorescens]|uniref:Uncharacterized protein n=1 Tax=Pseudomonas fluorescens TaxID=294 RepID=A0A0P8Z972_PSEFL|nr:hypothetical protein AN403_6077 [Pseudomonas fluorescens]
MIRNRKSFDDPHTRSSISWPQYDERWMHKRNLRQFRSDVERGFGVIQTE